MTESSDTHVKPQTPRPDRLWLSRFLLPGGTIALLIVTILAYVGITNIGFHFDDYPNIVNNDSIQLNRFSLEGFRDAVLYAKIPSRAVANASFALDWWRGSGRPEAYLETNLVLHLINALLVGGLLLLTLSYRQRTLPLPVIWGCLVGAAFWALHPIQVQAVAYIVQRMAELAALFSLTAVIAYLLGRRNEGLRRWLLYTVALIAFAMGILSKENAWITPLLIWLAEFGICRHREPLVRHPLDRLLLALPLLLFGYGLWDLLVEGPLYRAFIGETYALRDFTLQERLLTQPRVILFHLSQLIWPLPERFSLEHDFPLSQGLLEPPATLAALLLVFAWCAAGLTMLLIRTRRLTGFFMLWPPLTLSIESSVIPLEMIFEHRLYLPLAGFAGLVALAVTSLLRRSKPGLITGTLVPVLFITALVVAVHQRVALWGDPIRFYQDILRHVPDSSRAWNGLGLAHANAEQNSEAESAFTRAIRLNPANQMAWGNRGAVRSKIKGREQEGFADLEQALLLNSDATRSLVNRGNLLRRMDQPSLALRDYNRAIEVSPRYALAWNNRGLLRLSTRDHAGALEDFHRALRIEPENPEFLANRGSAWLLAGQPARALADLEAALGLRPQDAALHHNLGLAHRRLGQPAAAQEHHDIACRLGLDRACRTD